MPETDVLKNAFRSILVIPQLLKSLQVTRDNVYTGTAMERKEGIGGKGNRFQSERTDG